jgi:hypothetical protein
MGFLQSIRAGFQPLRFPTMSSFENEQSALFAPPRRVGMERL